jgi:hypothetical protein
VADFDGIILSDETYQGIKNKSKGDTVSKGEVLISGVVEGVDMKPLYYEAKGNFTALHNRYLEHELKYNQKFFYNNSVSEYVEIFIFGKKIPMGFYKLADKECNYYSYEKHIAFEGYRLPFSIKKTIAVKNNVGNPTKKEIEQIAILEFCNKEYQTLANTRIIDSKSEISTDAEKVVILTEYECIDFIGENKLLNIENSEIIKKNS